MDLCNLRIVLHNAWIHHALHRQSSGYLSLAQSGDCTSGTAVTILVLFKLIQYTVGRVLIA